MRLIPSISPEASVSGQGKQGMTPSGAHQCCSASPFLQAGGGGRFEAGAIQHQESPRIISGSCHLLGLSLWSPRGCCRAQGTRSRGSTQSSFHHLCKGSWESWSGVTGHTAPSGCIRYPRMLFEHVPSQRCPRKGMFEPRLG